jgi:hypothetical protein
VTNSPPRPTAGQRLTLAPSRQLTGTSLSVPMRDILLAALEAPDGVVRVQRLVARRVAGGRSRSVARASLSRTLRRLWRAGLVELFNTRWAAERDAMSRMVEEARARAERVRKDPVGDYAGY